MELQIRQPAQDELPSWRKTNRRKRHPTTRMRAPQTPTIGMSSERPWRAAHALRATASNPKHNLRPRVAGATDRGDAGRLEEPALDLDFMRQPPSSSQVDLFDLPDLTGGPRLPDPSSGGG